MTSVSLESSVPPVALNQRENGMCCLQSVTVLAAITFIALIIIARTSSLSPAGVTAYRVIGIGTLTLICLNICLSHKRKSSETPRAEDTPAKLSINPLALAIQENNLENFKKELKIEYY